MKIGEDFLKIQYIPRSPSLPPHRCSIGPRFFSPQKNYSKNIFKKSYSILWAFLGTFSHFAVAPPPSPLNRDTRRHTPPPPPPPSRPRLPIF